MPEDITGKDFEKWTLGVKFKVTISAFFSFPGKFLGGGDKCRKSDKMANNEFEEGSESQTCALLIDRGWKPEKLSVINNKDLLIVLKDRLFSRERMSLGVSERKVCQIIK